MSVTEGRVRQLRHWLDPYRGLTYGIVQAGPDIESGVPYIRPADMTDSAGVVDETALLRTSPDIARAYSRSTVTTGDIVLSIGPSYGKVMVVPETLNGANLTQGTALLAPGSDVDGRYFYWALQGDEPRQFWDAVVAGGTFRALNLGPLGETPLWIPNKRLQRQIADFLDDQVARIDEIIRLRKEQVTLISQRLDSELEALLVTPFAREVKQLQRFTDRARPIQYGIVLPGPDIENGVPIIKGGDIGAGRLSLELLKRTTHAIDAQYARSRVRGGDLVIAIRGSVGEVAVVPTELTGANLTQDSARIAPDRCDPHWLHAVLETPTVQQRMGEMITGATVKGINIGALRRILIPVPATLEDQRSLGTEAVHVRASAEQLARLMRQSIQLLQERKRSLITAAVTGQFDVTTASGRGVA